MSGTRLWIVIMLVIVAGLLITKTWAGYIADNLVQDAVKSHTSKLITDIKTSCNTLQVFVLDGDAYQCINRGKADKVIK